jgi:hypothetical protein
VVEGASRDPFKLLGGIEVLSLVMMMIVLVLISLVYKKGIVNLGRFLGQAVDLVEQLLCNTGAIGQSNLKEATHILAQFCAIE